MAKIEKRKKISRGKSVVCSKCGNPISVGETYLISTPYRMPAIIRCLKCGLKQYETSGSQYVRDVGAIVEDWQETFGTSDGTAEEIVSALEEIRDYTEESLNNMPEQLQEGDTGNMLQDRLDSLEGAISDLEEISFDDIKEESREEAEDNVGPYDENEFDDKEQWAAEVAEEMDRLTEDAYVEAIEDALSQLEY